MLRSQAKQPYCIGLIYLPITIHLTSSSLLATWSVTITSMQVHTCCTQANTAADELMHLSAASVELTDGYS